MNTTRLCAAALAALLSGCAGAATSVTPKAAPAAHSAASASVRQYHAESLNSLGGFLVTGISDNEQGLISGYSLLSDDATVHATLWYPGSSTATDLSTLGGTNSAVEWPNHTSGQVAGISQTATIDPLGEQWSCSAFIPYTGQECRGFAWSNGTMTPLGTLGGNNSFATGSNARGQIAGWAETAVHDSTCVFPQVLQFEGVVWDRSGHASVLPPLAGDPDSAATAIDDQGDAVGISGICGSAVGDLSAKHMVLWHNGVPFRLPSLGGSAWNTPEMINDEGDVVGFSDLAGDQNGNNFNAHAFLWTPGSSSSTDLGTLAGDAISYAYSINDRGQIVGQSCTPQCASTRAFLYQNGRMYDLNGLLDASSAGYYLAYANDVNDAGEITGIAIDPSGSIVGFRLVPDGTASATSVQAVTTRPHRALKYHFRIGPFGRPLIVR